jgi:hypothetical protein
MASAESDFKAIWQAEVGDRAVGHAHFWERALSRRQFVGGTAGLAGLVSALGLPGVATATDAGNGIPKPIPGGTIIGPLGKFHFYFPTSPNPAGSTATIESGVGDPSTITDFNGFLGVGEFTGGTGTDEKGTTLYWAADARFMDGEYVDQNGRERRGAFSFL